MSELSAHLKLAASKVAFKTLLSPNIQVLFLPFYGCVFDQILNRAIKENLLNAHPTRIGIGIIYLFVIKVL